MNLRPLCTAIVCPTMSGMIVERRDQVLITFFSRLSFKAATFFDRWLSTNGPFLTERAMLFGLFRLYAFDLRRRTMNASVRLLFRVFRPFVFQPHGDVGWRPPEVLPSPPPLGGSTGFSAPSRCSARAPARR